MASTRVDSRSQSVGLPLLLIGLNILSVLQKTVSVLKIVLNPVCQDWQEAYDLEVK